MNKYKVLLFDLDGTLSDPKVGITKSVQYALQKMNIEEPDLDKLECFIGPPLQASFPEFYHFDKSETKRAVDFYRERFKEKGMFENEIYEKIPALLQALHDQNFILTVATSKLTEFAEDILAYFNIRQFFELVVGSNLDGTRTSKTEIIEYILNQYPQYRLDEFIMIGDRKHDMIGANNTGIHSMGVSYGYGSLEELSLCDPTYIVHDIDQLRDILMGISSEKIEIRKRDY